MGHSYRKEGNNEHDITHQLWRTELNNNEKS